MPTGVISCMFSAIIWQSQFGNHLSIITYMHACSSSPLPPPPPPGACNTCLSVPPGRPLCPAPLYVREAVDLFNSTTLAVLSITSAREAVTIENLTLA